MRSTSFGKLAKLCENLEVTTGKLELAHILSRFLKGLRPDEIAPAVRMITGRLFPGWSDLRLEVSGATLWKVIDEITEVSQKERGSIWAETVDAGQAAMEFLRRRSRAPSRSKLSISDVYDRFQAICRVKGKGSRRQKEGLVKGLLLSATPLEGKYLVKGILGEMRHGVDEGIAMDAIAEACGQGRDLVSRAYMLWGDLGDVAEAALTRGAKGLRRCSVQVFRPLKPMLAQTAASVEEAFNYHNGRLALEHKLNGARVQIHKQKAKVRIFSRHLADVTSSLPEIAREVKDGLMADEAIVEGEVIAVGSDGRPLPFQHLMKRFRRVHEIEEMVEAIPTRLYLFDLLYVNGSSLIDTPYKKRRSRLEEVKGNIHLVERKVLENLKEGEDFLNQAYGKGHEGLMAKELESPYTPGVRGKSWFKIKPTVSLDLVILAADYGYGRRHGWLSNYHLAARDEERGEFLVVGKTFKGLTDREFARMTEDLKRIKVAQRGGTVYVRPKVVVEVAFNEIQGSSHYRSGFALRFARIKRIREDKAPEEADTLSQIRHLYERQFEFKGKVRSDR